MEYCAVVGRLTNNYFYMYFTNKRCVTFSIYLLFSLSVHRSAVFAGEGGCKSFETALLHFIIKASNPYPNRISLHGVMETYLYIASSVVRKSNATLSAKKSNCIGGSNAVTSGIIKFL
jgi:hypothetical protein